MTQQTAAHSYSRFYDQVLNEITYGKVEQGINFLVGMLDAADQQTGALRLARAELRDHLLHRLLLEDPLCAHGATRPNDSVGLTAILAGKFPAKGTSPTGMKLFAATQCQPIARALIDRQASIERIKARMADDGLAVLDCAQANIAGDGPFDLICATGLADRLESPLLTAELVRLRRCLSGTGRIIVSTTLPHHLGAGWRSACLNWNPCTYDEQELAQAAAKAGLTARIYRDEADCFGWAELRPEPQSRQGGDESHGH